MRVPRFPKRLLIVGLFALLAVPVQARDSESVWIQQDNGDKVEVRIRGSVEFADDATTIVRIARGASIYVEEKQGGRTRSIKVTPGDAGRFEYDYRVNGKSAVFDGDAQTLLAALLKRSVEEGGLNAEARAKRILAEQGPSGLLDLIERVKGDYLRTLYLTRLGRLDAATSRRALRVVATGVESDYYKAESLAALADGPLDDAETRDAFFAAYATVASDYYMSAVLQTTIERHAGDAELLRAAAGAVDRIPSDYYKAQVLADLADRAESDGALRAAIRAAAQKIESDYYREQVLSDL